MYTKHNIMVSQLLAKLLKSHFLYDINIDLQLMLPKEKDAEQTLEELNIMTLIKHPNVVLLMGACLSPLDQVVIITEYCDRGNLKDILPDVKSLWRRLKVRFLLVLRLIN